MGGQRRPSRRLRHGVVRFTLQKRAAAGRTNPKGSSAGKLHLLSSIQTTKCLRVFKEPGSCIRCRCCLSAAAAPSVPAPDTPPAAHAADLVSGYCRHCRYGADWPTGPGCHGHGLRSANSGGPKAELDWGAMQADV